MFSDRSGPEGTREMFVELRLTLVEEADEKDLNGGCGLSIKGRLQLWMGRVMKSDQRGVIDGCAENSMFSRRLSLLGYRRRGGRAGPNSVFTRIEKKKRWERKIRGEKVHDPYARHI